MRERKRMIFNGLCVEMHNLYSSRLSLVGVSCVWRQTLVLVCVPQVYVPLLYVLLGYVRVLCVHFLLAPPIVLGAWSMALVLGRPLKYYYYYYSSRRVLEEMLQTEETYVADLKLIEVHIMYIDHTGLKQASGSQSVPDIYNRFMHVYYFQLLSLYLLPTEMPAKVCVGGSAQHSEGEGGHNIQ